MPPRAACRRPWSVKLTIESAVESQRAFLKVFTALFMAISKVYALEVRDAWLYMLRNVTQAALRLLATRVEGTVAFGLGATGLEVFVYPRGHLGDTAVTVVTVRNFLQ